MPELRTSDFDYVLPEELIASRPPERRDASRMLVVDRQSGKIEHSHFTDFPALVGEDDLLILNDTRVVRSRFFSDDGKIEIVKLEAADATTWKCLVRPGKKMRIGRSTTHRRHHRDRPRGARRRASASSSSTHRSTSSATGN